MVTVTAPRRAFTTKQIAELLGCNTDKVLAFIRAGELRASNISLNPNGKRPRFRILENDLNDFLARRAAVPTSPGKKQARTIAKRAANERQAVSA